MVSTDLNQEDVEKQEMTLQFYIDSENGSEIQMHLWIRGLPILQKNIEH